MNNIERAVSYRYACERCLYTSFSERDDLTTCSAVFGGTDGPCGGDLVGPTAYLDDLRDAGLILTDHDRAVLDAAEVFERGPSWGGNAIANREALRAAVRARKAAQR